MIDPRYVQLANTLVGHSLGLRSGEKVMIEATDVDTSFLKVLIRAVTAQGAQPVLVLRNHQLMRTLIECGSEEQMRALGQIDAQAMSQMDAYIGVRGAANASEWSDIADDKMRLYQSLWWTPVHRDVRVPKTRWVVLRWPNHSMAQLAGLPTEKFEDFYFEVCTLDYRRLALAMEPLRELMAHTDRVHLVAPGTDLRFSIKDMPVLACDGRANIPDGEVFTSPVKESLEGKIRFNTPTLYRGTSHDWVELRLEQGRIVEANGSNPVGLQQILDADEGSRYFGEFALGVNPKIHKPMRDILFDEKIAGSLHMAIGNAYEEAFNGNRSSIHWDLILRMTPECGGGQVYFDDVLIRDDGRFTLPELQALEPEALLAG